MFNKKMSVFFLLLLLLISFFLFKFLLPVRIIAVYAEGSYADVLVKNFPLTDKSKIDWWQKNLSMMKKNYNVPEPSENGVFHVSFWDFDDGYKPAGKEDLLCFNQIKSEIRCIEKKKLMEVKENKNGEVSILTDDAYVLSAKNTFIMKN